MIFVIGIGEDGFDGLGKRARDVLGNAEVLAGGVRHLDMFSDFSGARVDWSQGIDAGLDDIASYVDAGLQVVVLASGDPLYFGVGKNVTERFGPDVVTVLPAPGAIDLACAAMGWSQPDVQVVTIHGRALESLNLYLTPQQNLVVLTQDGDTPAQVARLLTEQGFGTSKMVVLEHLGGTKERHIEGIANAWNSDRAADLNTLAITLIADLDARPLSRLAGLPDDAFDHDGQITKRAVRAVTLSSLAPLPGELLWDLGAGAGSISIEWMRTHRSCQALAVERDPVRAERIKSNAVMLGVPRLKIHVCDSLDALETSAAAPDAIFIGGGVSAPGLLAKAWDVLKPGGRLVANTVTPESALALKEFEDYRGGEHFVIAVENKAPITHYVGRKPMEN